MSYDPTSVFDRPIAFQRGFVSIGCGITGALLLSQACYWSKRTSNPDGWFYKTSAEWEEETGLTRREQETARARLRDLNVIDEERRGLPCKTYYRVDFNTLFILCGIVDTSLHKSAKQESTKDECCDVGFVESSTETTSETTSDINIVFDFWKEIMNKSNATKLSPKRMGAIKKRLSEGYSVEYIKQAIVKCSQTPYNMGFNKNGQKYNDIELICRDQEKLERFYESNPVIGSINHSQQKCDWGQQPQSGWSAGLENEIWMGDK